MAKCKQGHYWCYTDEKCKKIPLGWHVGRGGVIEKDEEGKDGNNKNGNGTGNGEPNGGSDGGSVSEESVSKAQQKFFGMVRAVQKGEANIGGDVGKAAASMKKKDVKDFASTKHKGLPERKKVDEGLRSSILSDPKAMKSIKDNEKVNYAKTMRMKHGKNWKEFVSQSKDAKEKLRPGEVKKWDKEKKKWVSNKD
jgi:hypothetical protein|tara:strand:+ start:2906 stop:3490 length:585 start_codon:yes stop_codon:yes gene_type:complete